MDLLVIVDVDDIDRAIAFYEHAFGLRLERRLFNGSVAELAGASSKIQLLQKPAGSAPFADATSMRHYDRHWTPIHLDFEVDDVARAVERAVAAGAKLEGSIRSFKWGDLALLSDPFGHGFCFLRYSDRGLPE